MYFIACIANPVFINTFVVFIRLHWFEKRFQSVVRDVRSARKARPRTRTVSEAKAEMDPDPGRVEAGVNGRTIQVLHSQPNGMTMPGADGKINGLSEKEQLRHMSESFPDANRGSGEGSGDSDDTVSVAAPHFLGQNPALKRDITFADELDRPSSVLSERASSEDRRDTEHHIRFLEKQRNKDQGTLRIPGPRDFDRGHVPRELSSDEEGNDIERSATNDAFPAQSIPGPDTNQAGHLNDDDHPVKKGLEFDEPERPHRGEVNTNAHHSTRFNPFHPLSGVRHRNQQPAMTFNHTMTTLRNRRTMSFTKSQERDMGPTMPYLSWQPTIGRNSQFPDLTEEQREELGGIEYRSLKTLALILVCYFLGFHLLGVIVLVPWIVRTNGWGAIIDADGQSRVWWYVLFPRCKSSATY